MVKAMSRMFELESKPATAVFDSIIPTIGSKYDIGVSSFIPSPERAKSVNFITYQHVGIAFVVKKGNPTDISTIDPDNLCGRHITVQTSNTRRRSTKPPSSAKPTARNPWTSNPSSSRPM